jgi:hypothetical protein
MRTKPKADYLGLANQANINMAGANNSPSFDLGKSWRISKADIDAWVSVQSAASEPTKAQ